MVRRVNEANDASLWDYELGKANTKYLKELVNAGLAKNIFCGQGRRTSSLATLAACG